MATHSFVTKRAVLVLDDDEEPPAISTATSVKAEDANVRESGCGESASASADGDSLRTVGGVARNVAPTVRDGYSRESARAAIAATIAAHNANVMRRQPVPNMESDLRLAHRWMAAALTKLAAFCRQPPHDSIYALCYYLLSDEGDLKEAERYLDRAAAAQRGEYVAEYNEQHDG